MTIDYAKAVFKARAEEIEFTLVYWGAESVAQLCKSIMSRIENETYENNMRS